MLVVGAGIAGLASARALGRKGIACDVVEREQSWGRDGTGIYLPANAIRALRHLGLDWRNAPSSAVISHQRFLNSRGRLLLDVDLADVWGSADPCVAMPREFLHAVLGNGLLESVRMGTTVTSMTQGPGSVDVTFADSSTRPYEVVVAADGIRSTMRRFVTGASDADVVRPVGQLAWRFLTRCPAQVTAWSVMLGRGSSFLTIPIGSGRAYCYADVSVADAETGDLASHFAGYAEPVGEILAAVDGAAAHQSLIEEVELDRWVSGRVVLIGDAAHATSPNMAQGAAMAMEDAVVLAECLGDGSDVDVALARFEQQRRPRTDWVRDQTHRRDHTRNLAPLVRNAALKVAGQRIFRSNYAPLIQAP